MRSKFRSTVLLCLALAAILGIVSPVSAAPAAPKGPVVLKFVETTDVHGSIFPYNFITDKPVDGSLAQLSSYLMAERADPSQTVILLDNGDILQGQPVVYYYNFENVTAPHIASQVMNYLGYDAGTLGNHDIEAGHPVYDRLKKEFSFPWMAANAVTPEGAPYFAPYTVLKRAGVKIAVIGLITPWIPNWLPQQFWTGMKFEDMVESAKKWVAVVREKEKPDLIVGLFHSGVDYTYGGLTADTPANENASELVAALVPGFDLVFTGHDHMATNKTVKNSDGQEVVILGAQNAMKNVAVATVTLTRKSGKWVKEIEGGQKAISPLTADIKFIQKFKAQFNEVKSYVSRPIGKMTEKISTRDSMFEDSAFVDLIHNIQLELAGSPEFGLNKARISFAAPLSFNAVIPSSADGTLYVRDMFNLYQYENFLYTMTMTGKQVKDFMEFSYAGWMNTMKDDADHLISFKRDADGNVVVDEKSKAPVTTTRYYNYDSAAGIVYTVDVSKPVGSRVAIVSMADGSAFDPAATYSVAINSYRAQGGGGHLTTGAGMDPAEVKAMKYVTSSTIKDLRYYIMKWIEAQSGALSPKPNGNWKAVPEDWAAKGKAKDWALLYP